MIRKNIQITEQQNDALRKLAYETKLSEAEHIRRALNHYLTATYGANYIPEPWEEEKEA